MTKRNILIVVITALLCTTYIFAIDRYDSLSTKIRDLKKQVIIEDFRLEEVNVTLSGIGYDEPLEFQELVTRQNNMIASLSHEIECSKLCKQFHYSHVMTSVYEEVEKKELIASRDEDTYYEFAIKNQKDLNYNTYYNLVITGLDNLEEIDKLRMRGYDELKSWQVIPKESIAFTGYIEGFLTKEETNAYKEEILKNLSARETGYYEDDITGETLAYYGYTKAFSDYITEADGDRSNIQITFTKDEEKGNTVFIIAFPFYNTPF